MATNFREVFTVTGAKFLKVTIREGSLTALVNNGTTELETKAEVEQEEGEGDVVENNDNESLES